MEDHAKEIKILTMLKHYGYVVANISGYIWIACILWVIFFHAIGWLDYVFMPTSIVFIVSILISYPADLTIRLYSKKQNNEPR